jgi:hypothetical protein
VVASGELSSLRFICVMYANTLTRGTVAVV